MTEPESDAAPASPFPPVIVGGWQLSAGHRSDPSSLEDLLVEFTLIADAGLRTFDCADIYTGVEEFLGEFRRRYRNIRGTEAADAIRVHTKYVPDFDRLEHLTRADVVGVVDRSLSRLGVERLDLVQFAWWDYRRDNYVEVVRWLDDLRTSGKIARLGATNFDTPRLREFTEAGVTISAHQVQFSALDHRPEGGPGSTHTAAESMATTCEARGTALLCYGSLAGGFLSDAHLGRSEPQPPFANRSLVKYRLIIDEYGGWDRFQSLLELLRGIADAHEASIAQVALAYALSRPGVSSVIVGASSAARIIDAARACTLKLQPEQLGRIRMLAATAPGPAGPVFGLERDRTGPHGRIMKYNLDTDRG
jgi:aryl-alcohol dehydrogenase-like predicted oxidoreductase